MNVVSMQGVLKAYEVMSGQLINFSKSSVSFSNNVLVGVRDELAGLLGVRQVAAHDVYLGLPVVVGRSKVLAFHFLVDKVKSRVDNWYNKSLSAAGKVVLIQSVAQAILAYVMTSFEIPVRICNEIQQIIAKFWWGDSSSSTKVHWLAWDKWCNRKHEGGLGFRDFRSFNLALLAKQGWRILTNPDSMVSLILKAKYFPEGSFMEVEQGNGCSYVWKSILKGRQVLEMGLRYIIGNGENVKVWKDRWLALPYNFQPFTKPREGYQDARVEILLDKENQCCNGALLLDPFADYEVELIESIPLSNRFPEDVLMWHYNSNGVYLVKSGYWSARERRKATDPGYHGSSASNSNMGKYWQKIWKLHTPPKITFFLWRTLSRCLPTRGALIKRHIMLDDSSCVSCNDELEDDNHIFRCCEVTQEFWEETELQGGGAA